MMRGRKETTMAQFMLLIRGGQDAAGSQTMTPEQVQQALQQYFAWSDTLQREGRLIGAEELASGGKTVRMQGGQIVVDGPYAETKDAIGGYYLIEAADEDEAAEIAKGCPTLNYGGFVQVRGIVDHSA
jgi:hypothetical protein